MNTPTTSPQEWDEDSVDFFEEPEEGIIKVGDRPVMVYCPTSYGGGDMGFYKDEWSIKVIYDCDGKRRKPVFNAKWKEIAPGIATANRSRTERSRYGDCKQAILIERRACPVRVVFRYVSEYNDYDDYEACRYHEKTIETLFEAAEEAE